MMLCYYSPKPQSGRGLVQYKQVHKACLKSMILPRNVGQESPCSVTSITSLFQLHTSDGHRVLPHAYGDQDNAILKATTYSNPDTE
jgi:hypothetical protein